MSYEEIKKDIFSNCRNNGNYPKNIKINKDLLRDLKEAGYISLSPTNPSKVTFLGIEVLEDHEVSKYELV